MMMIPTKESKFLAMGNVILVSLEFDFQKYMHTYDVFGLIL